MVEYGSNLERTIGEFLIQNDHTRRFEIEVSDNNGIIELRGKVPTEEDRQAVARSVETQPGVVKVINHLQLLEEDEPVAEDDDFPELDRGDEPPAIQPRSG